MSNPLPLHTDTPPSSLDLSADSTNPVFRLTAVNGQSQTTPVGDLPIATIPSLRRSVTPGASGLQAAPSLGLPPSRIPSPAPSNYGAASSLVSLPSLPKYHAESDSLSSSPEHRKTDSSVYYTTAWGSPYATPSPKRHPSSFLRNRRREEGGYSNNTNSEEDSPSSTKSTHSNSRKISGSNHKGSVKPSSSRVSRRFYGSIGRGAARGRQGNPIKDFTEEWINQYLSGQPRTERTNWLSDDSADSGTGSFLTARNHLSEDQSEGWLGLEDDSQDEDLLKTPTSRSFGRNKSKDLLLPRDNGRPPRSRVLPKHIPKKSTDTLKQSDFWDIGHELAPTPTSAAAMSDKEASSKASLSPHPNGSSSAGDLSLPISPIDKPLPPPPPNEANGGVNHPPLPASPLVVPKQTRTSTPGFQRPRKKVQWGKKQCIIALPLEDRRGSSQGGFHLLTPTDVASRLKKWEEQGYDDGSHVKGLDAISQSRPAFPDPHESQREWRENKYTISFPDQFEWEALVSLAQIIPSIPKGSPSFPSSPHPPRKLQGPLPILSQQQQHHQQPQQQEKRQRPHEEDPSQLVAPRSNTETPADSDATNSPSSGPEIAHPTPRGHRHNVSETLQKGVEQAEYHLEDVIRRQLEEEDKNEHDCEPTDDLMKSRWAVADEPVLNLSNVPAKVLPQQLLFGGQNDDGEGEGDLPLDASDINTNPSLSGSFHGQFGDQTSTTSFKPRHRSCTSASTLNVEAREFDPSGSFDFQPSHSIFSPRVSQHSATSSSAFNVTAPSFAPLGGSNKNTSPSISSNTNFNFSTASFNIDAPVFNPGRSFASGSTADVPSKTAVSGSDGTHATAGFTGGKIFGDFDMSSVIIKPAKLSKAIPIIRPDDISMNNTNVNNKKKKPAEAAGTVGPLGREKRARREGSDGDKEVEFELPSHSPVGGNGDDMVPLNDIVVPAGGKENANAVSGVVTGEPEVDQNIGTDSKDIYPVAPTTADTMTTVESVTPVSKDTPVSQTAEWRPFEFKNRFEAAAFNDAFPSGPGVHGLQMLSDSKGQNRVEPANEDPAAVTVERAEISVDEQISKSVGSEVVDSSSKVLPSVLKPTAEAFEFKPAAPVVTPVPALVKQMQPSSGPKNNVGLEGSRYAVSTPPSSPPPAKYLASTIPQHSPMVDNLRALEEEEEETLPLSEVMTEDAEHDSLNEDEIDAVMKQLNDDNADLGIERFNTPQPPNQDIFAGQSTQPQLVPSYTVRSNAPSPSIKGSDRPFRNLPRIHSDLDGKSQHLLSPKRSALSGGSQSPVRHLNNPEIEHVSDWDDAVSVGEDAKLRQRSIFFDRHVNEIVGRILENRLDPLEQTLGIIQQSLDVLASRSVSQRRSISAEVVEHSDADDEDEGEDDTFMKYRSRSPLNRRDRRVDKIKQAVAEALASQVPRIETIPPPPPPPVPALAPLVDLSEIQTALAEIKTLAMSKPTEPAPEPLTDIRQVIIDAISEHPRLNAPVESVSQIDNMEALKFQVEGMQAMLRVAEERAEKEYQTRKDAQDSLAQCQRLLRIAEEDAAQHRESALKAEETLKDLRERRLPETERIERQAKLLQEQQESLQLTLSELSMKNITLEETLDEYRVSADHWKSQVEHVKSENKDLKLTINHMKRQIEDSMAARQGLRKKFERLQEDMSSASGNFAFYEASWRKKEEDLIAKNTALRASYEREVKLREKLEMEIGDLQQQEKEATKLRFIFGQSQQENARLEELLMTLRQENHDLQNKAARFEREFNEARESSHAEIKRTRKSMEADLDAANNQVNYVRAELESQISSLQNQLDGVRLDADTAKARHELQLEEATDAKRLALTESAESKENALQEQRLLHERGLNDLRERHARALHNASEDRQRGESHLMELLALRDEKIEHLEDKLVLVEEKLEIAKSAARAAAQAAQNAKTTSTLPPSQPTSPSMTFRRGSEIPEKISPQALRESIMVLQDQLQQREGRIEELEQELAAIDKYAPAKVKERETEINWLRELLGVRLDDLQDIINTLSQPSFNQQAVRDAAIRLKANMQMEQQEKERAMSGGNGNGSQQFPAAAWGNWRKARENSVISNPSPANTKMAKPASTNANDHRTPSKGSNNSPPSFLSGLLTPPSSNVRQSSATYSAPPGPMPMGTGSRRTYSESRPLRHYNNINNSGGRNGPRRPSARRGEKLPQELELELELELEPPTTPPLLRQSSYDQDAQARNYHGYGSYGDDEDSMIGGVISSQDEGRVGGGDAPFGPSI
ncbi:myosin class II heavy chain [Histoplasma capsulatum]|uniref:Myosin class II heavy chain n=1 Tax=Ajellomyces capsulatus TaxID=5037 RepID=A0A8A1M4X5_AJECA|nr:myosin class II heavy chain [Histoplasma capsulatum]